jgi:hypothetical protein
VTKRESTPEPDPLTPEQAEKGYRALRTRMLAALGGVLLLAVAESALHPHIAVFCVIAVVAYIGYMALLLRYLKSSIDKRVVRPDNVPDIGL